MFEFSFIPYSQSNLISLRGASTEQSVIVGLADLYVCVCVCVSTDGQGRAGLAEDLCV